MWRWGLLEGFSNIIPLALHGVCRLLYQLATTNRDLPSLVGMLNLVLKITYYRGRDYY